MLVLEEYCGTSCFDIVHPRSEILDRSECTEVTVCCPREKLAGVHCVGYLPWSAEIHGHQLIWRSFGKIALCMMRRSAIMVLACWFRMWARSNGFVAFISDQFCAVCALERHQVALARGGVACAAVLSAGEVSRFVVRIGWCV